MKKNRPPLAEITELLGHKWIMRIIWELRDGPLTFRGLQAACDDLSPSVLNDRLKRLEDALLVEKGSPGGYAMTDCGLELLKLYKPLNDWAVNWQKQLQKAGR